MRVNIEASWKQALLPEFSKPYFEKLSQFVHKEYASDAVYPPPKFIFNAFTHTPIPKVKVVIIGQDPYHGHGQANGLCFSVNPGVRLPPSLQNIYKELESDVGVKTTSSGDLTHWADQGVLLLNATLTVRASKPGSHQDRGWEIFTDSVIHTISEIKNNLVFILWGAYAQKKGQVIAQNKGHLILRSPHPSPFSAHSGFFGSAPFSKTNTFLMLHGQEPINW